MGKSLTPHADEMPCLVCGVTLPVLRKTHQSVCVACGDKGWRARTCPACGERPLHHRDYTSSQYRKSKILKCGWCRKRDREGPDPFA